MKKMLQRKTIALVLSAVFILSAGMMSACSKSEDASEKKREESIESAEDDVTPTPEPTEEITPTPTPEIIATPTETPDRNDPEKVKADAYKAYLEVLQSHSEEILFFANTFIYTTDYIVIDDVNDDSIPDLLFMAGNESDYYQQADLHIYTYNPDKGEAFEVYVANSLDFMAASGGVYTVFSRNDTDEIVISSAGGDLDWFITITTLTFNINEGAQETDILEYESYEEWSEDGSDIIGNTVTVTHDGMTYGEDYYNDYISDLSGRVDKILISDEYPADNMFGWDTWNSIAMSYDEAIAFLSDSNSGDVDFSAIAGTYCFSSGVGAWMTEMTIYDDGTFEGGFHDSEYTSGEGYASVLYVAEFEGSFSGIRQTGGLTYEMELADLTFTKTEADNYIDDQFEGGMLYSYQTTAYGLDDATTIEIYLPGYLKSDLTEDALGWYNCTAGYSDQDATAITVMCLYNVNAGQLWTREF